MRIVLDMQGAQTNSRFRGIGRYTVSMAQALLRIESKHEIFLAFNASMPEAIADVRMQLGDLIKEENVLIWYGPGSVQNDDNNNDYRRRVAEECFKTFLQQVQTDLLFVSSYFESLTENAVTCVAEPEFGFSTCVVVYDLIPLLNQEHYLFNPVHEANYKRKLKELQGAAGALTISEFSRAEALEHLSFSADQIVNTYLGAEENFRPRVMDAVRRQSIMQSFKLDRPFLLYAGGSDERKNLPRLIKAFAALPEPMRQSYQLLFAGKFSVTDQEHLQALTHALGIDAASVCFTGYISDDTLIDLYNLCTLFVFPSWHEGFGLPVLEAMASGAPAIAANCSSLPEVLADPVAMFDPFDVADMSKKIAEILGDDALRQSLIKRGTEHAKSFSWQKSASIAMDKFEQILARLPKRAPIAVSTLSDVLRAHYQQLIQRIVVISSASKSISEQDLRDLARCIDRNQCEALRVCSIPLTQVETPRRVDLIQAEVADHQVLEWNRHAQGVTVSSHLIRKLLIDAGVFVPIFVEEEDLTAWTALSDAQEVHLSTKKFLFVCEVSNIESDGFDVLLSAYAHSFCEKDDVSLVVLVDLALANAVIAYVDAWKERGADLAGTVIVAPSDETMRKAIFLQSHCLVLPYRFQDVSLSVRRAVALGLPVITTGWGAQVDVKIESPSFNRVRNLDYRFVRCLDEPSLFNNYWAEPDEKHLSRLMLEQFSTAGSSQAEGGSTINAPATAANQLSRKWSQGFSLRPLVIGWVTTWNVRCGIATYSEHLTECIPDDVMILAPRLADKLGLDCDNVIRCWDHTDPNLDELNAAVKRHGINALVVQFNYGFFEFPAITKFLQMQASRGVKVIITLHSTVDPAHAPERRLSLLVPALRTCHRILVHSVSDLNRLKKLGLIDNVTLFPHGVKEISHQASEPSLQVLQSRNSDDFVMASYGFFLPHKGLFELIDAVALLRAKGCNVVLNMFNAQYPNVESQQLVQQANLKIQALGLTQFIKLNSDFLSDEESLAQLKGADLVVYPYQETGESASGAVRFGLAALRPVAVTPLAIFDDVSQAVFKMPGCSTDQIADGLFDLIEGLKSNSNEVIAKRQVLYAWTMAHQYPKLAARLVGIFKACA